MRKDSIYRSADVEDIIKVNARSAKSKNGIKIIELSTLGEVISFDEAERIRETLLGSNVQVQQLTNTVSFGAWTKVENFVKQCMEIRYINSDVLPIKVEVLMFDNIVAFYRVESDVSVLVVEDVDFARQQRASFDTLWEKGQLLPLKADGGT